LQCDDSHFLRTSPLGMAMAFFETREHEYARAPCWTGAPPLSVWQFAGSHLLRSLSTTSGLGVTSAISVVEAHRDF
jgi:hypothetical protein